MTTLKQNVLSHDVQTLCNIYVIIKLAHHVPNDSS